MAVSQLKLTRMQRGITQWELARRAGMPESKLSRVENGRIPLTPELAARLARELGVSPDEILSGCEAINKDWN